MRFETVWIQSANAKLYGELRIPDAIPASAVLICHGMNARGSHGLRIYAQFAEEACKAGFVTLVFDFRGVGKSAGSFDYGVGEQEDVKSALDYLASRPEATPNSVFVAGHSLGGAVSLYALQKETRVKGLVLWSTPKDHNYNVRKFIKRTHGTLGLYRFLIVSRIDRIFNISGSRKLEVYGINLRPRYVREKLMRLNECDAASMLHSIPLLVVIGESDVVVGVDEAQEIYHCANEPKTLLIINSADHIYKGKENELIDKTIGWMKKLRDAAEP